jgi:1,4-alpha-glucan branching enzyme
MLWFLVAMTLGIAAPGSVVEAQSPRPGVGATLYDDADGYGVTFRTWAPNADSVSVAGSFNSFNPNAHFLTSEKGGWWSIDIPYVSSGARYKFVIRNDGNELWRRDPWARRLTNSVGDPLVHDAGAYQFQSDDYTTPSWNEVVIYEMHVGTYGALPGDPVPANFDDCIDNLDHLMELGVNCIELMPVNEFAGDINWGYNVAFPWSVESSYGGPDALKRFVDACHQRGIAVILDVLYNHWGPSDLDFWQYDGWSENGNGGIFFYNDDVRADTPWGPRPDYARGEVRSFIRDNALLWLEEFRIDGLRFDATKYIRGVPEAGIEIPEGWSLLQWINESIDASQPWKITIAEDFGDNEWLSRSVGEGGAGFESQWDGVFLHPVRALASIVDDSDRSMEDLRDAVTKYFNGQSTQRVVFTESHDEAANQPRLPEVIWPANADSWEAKKRSTLAASVVFTSPGIPMIFQGQEFFEDGTWTDAAPMDWARKETFNGIFQLYRDLISLRRDLGGATRGLIGNSTNFHHLNDQEKIGAWHRFDQGGVGDDVVVVTNWKGELRDSYRIGFPNGGTWYCIFNSNATGYDAEFTGGGPVQVTAETVPWDGMGWSAEFEIPPYTALVFSRKRPENGDDGGDQDGPIVVDGVLDPLYGESIVVQDTASGFGDNDLGLVDHANGSELDGLHARVEEGILYIHFAGNLETNFNKLDVFIDAIPGEGQNRLRADNPEVKFGGLNRMGGSGRGTEPGLRFDAGFGPDFWIDFTAGGEVGLSHETYINWSRLATGGGADVDWGFAGPGGAGAGLAISTDNGIIASIDNSNVLGVSEGEGLDDGTGVDTGIEFAIPLTLLDHEAGDPIAIAAFINGPNHDFLSNQVIGPLGGAANLGEPRLVDFQSIPGEQFAIAIEGADPDCTGDFNGDGEVNGADFGAMLANWGSCDECPADLDQDGSVAGADVGLLLAVWGPCP